MEKQDFKFDAALESELTAWVKSNIYLREAVKDHTKLFKWEEGRLQVKLDQMSHDYGKKFIDPGFVDYCKSLLTTIEKPLSEFLINYGLPSINISVMFVFRGLMLGRSLTVKPELPVYPKMKILKS